MEHLIYWIGGIVFSIAGLIIPFIFKEIWSKVKKLEEDTIKFKLDAVSLSAELKSIKDTLQEVKQLISELPCKELCLAIKKGNCNEKDL